MLLEWEPGLSVGVEAFDVQHRQIVRRLCRLGEAIGSGRVRDARAELRFLGHYLAQHFAEEERWMEESGYPGLSDHAASHRRCVAELRAARSAFEATGDLLAFAGAAESVARWQHAHLRGDDLRMGRFGVARENLRLLARGGPIAPTLTPLPTLPALTPEELERAGGREPGSDP